MLSSGRCRASFFYFSGCHDAERGEEKGGERGCLDGRMRKKRAAGTLFPVFIFLIQLKLSNFAQKMNFSQ